jgi:hypothetical protein
MRLPTLLVAGIGYLAGNEKARRMVMDGVAKLRTTPPARAVEDKVSGQVSELSSKMSRTRNSVLDLATNDESGQVSTAGTGMPASSSSLG